MISLEKPNLYARFRKTPYKTAKRQSWHSFVSQINSKTRGKIEIRQYSWRSR